MGTNGSAPEVDPDLTHNFGLEIEVDKQYKTRSGHLVYVESEIPEDHMIYSDGYRFMGLVTAGPQTGMGFKKGMRIPLTAVGRIHRSNSQNRSDHDLVEEVPFEFKPVEADLIPFTNEVAVTLGVPKNIKRVRIDVSDLAEAFLLEVVAQGETILAYVLTPPSDQEEG